MNKNTGDGELLKYFWPFPYPKHKPPIEVIFSNGVPQSDDPDHMVFQIPYNTFEQAIKKYTAQEANKAQQKLLQELMEQQLYIVERAVDKDGKAYPPGYKGSMFVPLSVIQNKLEGLS